ncbi:retrovirus-related pol polyprotein from transposon tnt 1-94 [Trifolium medium]|uniref:Retrovirus-related pol polyprotein from transposon tnt 1-94 n=1 Tax=Trifolium medium TaxID=97028 RepID=A0A392TF88_9FABA|nr:retrovirus-related pol polyprotein from transposon tnt 1-94 [Trifolium medium]
MKCVRADNGGEYRGPFEEYCKKNGIKLEKTVPKTPQHNKVAERMKTAVDLVNLSPSIPLDGDVPNRVWQGKDVSYGYLSVWL